MRGRVKENTTTKGERKKTGRRRMTKIMRKLEPGGRERRKGKGNK